MRTFTKTGEQMARDVAVSLADDVRALEHLISGLLGPEVGNDIAGRADQMVSDYSDGDDYDGRNTVDAYLAGVLDVEIDGRFTNGGWEVRKVGLLVGYGGPTSRMTTTGDGEVDIVVNWCGDTATVTVYAPNLADRIWELSDGI